MTSLAVIALTLGACGDDGDDATPSPASTATSAPATVTASVTPNPAGVVEWTRQLISDALQLDDGLKKISGERTCGPPSPCPTAGNPGLAWSGLRDGCAKRAIGSLDESPNHVEDLHREIIGAIEYSCQSIDNTLALLGTPVDDAVWRQAARDANVPLEPAVADTEAMATKLGYNLSYP